MDFGPNLKDNDGNTIFHKYYRFSELIDLFKGILDTSIKNNLSFAILDITRMESDNDLSDFTPEDEKRLFDGLEEDDDDLSMTDDESEYLEEDESDTETDYSDSFSDEMTDDDEPATVSDEDEDDSDYEDEDDSGSDEYESDKEESDSCPNSQFPFC